MSIWIMKMISLQNLLLTFTRGKNGPQVCIAVFGLLLARVQTKAETAMTYLAGRSVQRKDSSQKSLQQTSQEFWKSAELH